MDDFELHLELHAQREEIAQLRAALSQVESLTEGLMTALFDILLPLVRQQPEIARILQTCWAPVSERYEALEQAGQHDDSSETLELLEARKFLYRALHTVGAFPAPQPEK
ncbi:hypothetical protein ACTJNK_21670 [Achromobacter anxifer]